MLGGESDAEERSEKARFQINFTTSMENDEGNQN